MVGSTEPRQAAPGTIRGDFAIVESYAFADTKKRVVRNLIHASGNKHDAEKEMMLWFTEKELLDYRLIQEEILYDVNVDGMEE